MLRSGMDVQDDHDHSDAEMDVSGTQWGSIPEPVFSAAAPACAACRAEPPDSLDVHRPAKKLKASCVDLKLTFIHSLVLIRHMLARQDSRQTVDFPASAAASGDACQTGSWTSGFGTHAVFQKWPTSTSSLPLYELYCLQC